jgi:hypothetical protein
MYRNICILLLVLTACRTAAQKQRSLAWYIKPQAVLLNGDHKVSGAAQVSGGVRICNQWFVGAGGAVDYYKVRSAPVFLEAMGKLNKRPAAPFLYTKLGYNIAWPLEYQRTKNGWDNSVFNNGWYAEGGLGYTWPTDGNGTIQLSLGYSVKTLQEKYTEYPWGNAPSVRTRDYTFNRLAVSLAFCW